VQQVRFSLTLKFLQKNDTDSPVQMVLSSNDNKIVNIRGPVKKELNGIVFHASEWQKNK